ncbi:MAG: FmdB family zinc ribbon protein [Vicinamibacterales bacterium]
MPLYEYECTACAHRFEVIQKFSDAPVSECPKCGGAVEKLLSSPAIQFKGSGFYLTDYGRGTGKADAAGSKNGKGSAAGDSSGSKDSAKSDGGSTGDAKNTSGTAAESKPATTSKPATSGSE